MNSLRQESAPCPKGRLLCVNCVEDAFVKAEIEKNGRNGTCSYCDLDGQVFSIDQFADLVETALSQHFSKVSISRLPAEMFDRVEESEDVFSDQAGSNLPAEPIGEVIGREAGIDEPIVKDVLQVLGDRQREGTLREFVLDEGAFESWAHYFRNGLYDPYWSSFERSIKTKARFFNRDASWILARMFQVINGHKTIHGRPVIVEVGPGTGLTVLYRARVFQDESRIREAMKRPDLDVGPPPSEMAIAGRMNAAGIVVFYGATHPDVALAEVQPPVGSKVLIGHFELTRLLRLLDTEALELVDAGKGSVFDPDYINRLERVAFLRGLSHRIAKPVMPDDRVRDYLPTPSHR